MSPTSTALLIGIATFVVGLAICIAIFVALDVKMILVIGPAVGVAFAAYSAYKSALRDVS